MPTFINQNKFIKYFFWFFLFVLFFGLNFLVVKAVPNVSDLLAEQEDLSENEKDDIEEKYETLEEKAENYRKMINLKQKQKSTLQNQLKLMDLQAETLENDISIKEDKIKENENKISSIENEVKEKEKEIDKSKKQLSELVINYDHIEKEITLSFLSSKGNLAEIFNNSAYISQVSERVQSSLSLIKIKKEELNKKQDELRVENQKLSENKKELEDKVYFLDNEKFTKNMILEKTKGEEGKYQELLSRVEAQKQELLGSLDDLSTEVRGALDDILDKAPKPSSGLASTNWYYSQKDSNWGHNRIGLSSSLMRDYGCAVTSLAMIFTYHKQSINPGKLAAQPIFYRDLIVWPQYWKGLTLASSTAHGSVNWSDIDKQLKKENPVIVFVRARGGKGHYVVVHSKDKKGKYVVHDPLFGANLFLETTKDLVGAIYNSGTIVDQAIYYDD